MLLVASLDNGGDVDVTLVCDNGFSVVVKLFFGSLDVIFNMTESCGVYLELCENLVVSLENLNSVPSLL